MCPNDTLLDPMMHLSDCVDHILLNSDHKKIENKNWAFDIIKQNQAFCSRFEIFHWNGLKHWSILCTTSTVLETLKK